MKPGSRMGYQGSRAYARQGRSLPKGSWLERLGAPLAAWTKRKLDWLLRRGAKQAAETLWLVHGKEKHFSLLGAEYDRKPRRAAAPCPFPDGEVRNRRPIRDRTDAE